VNAERIESLVQKVQSLEDSSARDAALELVQAVMELHANGLEKMLDIVSDAEGGAVVIDAIAHDPLAGSMLLLHDLHPLDLETRVRQALDRPEFRSRGAEVELLSIRDAAVWIRVKGGSALRTAVEQAVFEAAPDAAAVNIEGGSEAFVPLAQLLAS
jgi:hypothetical protein